MKDLNNKHQVKSLLFDLIFDDELRAQELYNDVRQLHYEELERVISGCLDEFAGPGAFAQLKEVELDLGVIHYKDLQSELPQRIYDSLSRKLGELFKGLDPKEQPMLKEVFSKIDLIRYFLVEGYLPWNTKENTRTLLNSILSDEPAALAKLFRQIGSSPRVRQRIIYSFSSATIGQIINVLAPQNSKLIIQFHQLITDWASRNGKLNLTQNKLNKDIWSFILNYLLLRPQQTIHIHSLFREVLIQFSEKSQLPFSQLFLQLSDEVNQNGKREYFVLKDTFREVSKVLNLPHSTKSRIASQFSQLSIEEQTHILFQFLHTRSIQPKVGDLRPALLQQHFMQMLRIEPVVLIDFLREPTKPSVAIKRIVDRFSVGAIHELIQAIEPSHHKTVISYQNNLLVVHQKERLVSVSEKSLSGSLWKMILQLLLMKAGSHFNQKSFLRMLIVRISAHYNIDYYELVEQLYQMIFKVSSDSSRMPLFIQLIREIYQEETLLVEEAPALQVKTKQDKNEKQKRNAQNEKKQEEEYEEQLAFLNILRQYLIKGSTSKSLSRLRTLFLKGLKTQATEILDALRNPAVFPASVQRIVRDFDEKLIQELIKAIEPIHYQSVFHFQRHIIQLQKEEPVVRTSETELSDALWNLILQILLFRPASHFNQKSFLKNLLVQTAAHYNTNYFDLVDQLCKTAKLVQSKSTAFQSFLRLIQEIQTEEEGRRLLRKEEEAKAKSKEPKEDIEEEEIVNVFDSKQKGTVPVQLLRILFQATTDPTQQLRAYGFMSVAEAVQHLSSYHEEVLIAQLKKYTAPMLNDFIQQLPVDLQNTILQQLPSTYSIKVYHLLDTLNRKLYQTGFSERVVLLSALRNQSLFFLLQHPVTSINQLLLSLEEILDDYDLPSSLFEFSGAWQVPVSGNIDGNLLLMEKRINMELKEKDRESSKNLLLLKELIEGAETTSYAYAKKEEEMKVEQEIYISNAGLVILNGYLNYFFQQCGFFGESGFESREKAQRAALLLQYVFAPEGEYREEQMVLNKLLCGLPLYENLPMPFEANEQEKAITAQMLDAIIAHWKIISNSSHEGFRESWLQREGKLTKKEKHWELVVEKKAFDVLLDYKPFTLSPVGFSWMDKPIKVEWR